MIKMGLFQGCKDSSIYTNQSMWYTILTNWKIKTIWSFQYMQKKPLTKFSTHLWFSSVQSLSPVRLFATPWIAARQASLSITNSQSLLKLMPIELVMPSSHLILCCPLLLLPPIPPSIRVFSTESTLHMRWPKYWSFSFSVSPSNEHPGLISFIIKQTSWPTKNHPKIQARGAFALLPGNRDLPLWLSFSHTSFIRTRSPPKDCVTITHTLTTS